MSEDLAARLERAEQEANRLALLTTKLVQELRVAEGNRGGRIDNEKALDVANEAVERLNGTVARLKGLLGHGDAHKCEDRPEDGICRILAAA